MFDCPSILDVEEVLIIGLVFPLRIFIIDIRVKILMYGVRNWLVFLVFLSPHATIFVINFVFILIGHCNLARIVLLIELVGPG